MTRPSAASLIPNGCVSAGKAGWMKFTPITNATLEANTKLKARRCSRVRWPRPKKDISERVRMRRTLGGSLLGSTAKRLQSLERVVFLAPVDSRARHGSAQNLGRFVINFPIHRIGMAVFAAVREAELRGIFPRGRRAVRNIGDQCESAECFGADAG